MEYEHKINITKSFFNFAELRYMSIFQHIKYDLTKKYDMSFIIN